MPVPHGAETTYTVQMEADLTGTRLVDPTEAAVYRVELGYPVADQDDYRVEAVRSTRLDYGVEMEQRLTLATYPSQMEAEEHLGEVAESLMAQGGSALPLADLRTQPTDYAAGYLVATYPPDAILSGEAAAVVLLSLHEQTLHETVLVSDLPAIEAARLTTHLETLQQTGGVAALIAQAAQLRDLEPDQNLFPPAQTAALDQHPPVPDAQWGWHDYHWAVLPTPEQTHQVALLEIYRDALSDDIAGSYLPVGSPTDAVTATQQRDRLELQAFEATDSLADWRGWAEQQVDRPQWQSCQPDHYALYERLTAPPELPTLPLDDDLFTEINHLCTLEINTMNNTPSWETTLNEHVTYLPPYVTAEYQSPTESVGVPPVRLRLVDDPAPYQFEVSPPDEQGAVTLSALKHLEDGMETTPLKTYTAEAGLEPRGAALEDARALVYEWGRQDVDQALGSALHLAHTQGYLGDTLFASDPPLPEGRPVHEIRAERLAEREAELTASFPDDEPTQPLPARTYSRMLSEAAYEVPLEEGQAYEFRARPLPELEHEVARYGVDAQAVETVKHWQTDGQPQREVVTLGIYYDREDAREEVDAYVQLAEQDGIQTAMTRAAILADAQSYPSLVQRAEELDLHLNADVRYGAMFHQGPPDPFLAEQDLPRTAPDWLVEHFQYHDLSVQVLPVTTPTGDPLGQAVVAVDAQWSPNNPERELAEAQQVTAYELGHFQQTHQAEALAGSLHEYFYKRDLATEGEQIQPALEFVQGFNATQGLPTHDLPPTTLPALMAGEWTLQHEPETFQPALPPSPELAF